MRTFALHTVTHFSMSVTTESLTHLFPLDEGQIPEAWRRPEPLHQRQYLLDGELRE